MFSLFTTRRMFLLGLLVASSLTGPWWAPLVIGVVLLLLENAPEVLAIGVLLDVAYAPLGGKLFFVYFLIFLVVWLGGELLRKRLLLR